MWAIKILKGPQQGQTLPLKNGNNIVGRSPSAQIHLNSQGISKEHACLQVEDRRLVLKDLDSRNGSFVNGSKVRQRELKVGDKVILHDVIFEILDNNSLIAQVAPGMRSGHGEMINGNTALRLPDGPPAGNFDSPNHQTLHHASLENKNIFVQYFERVVLPGVIQLIETFEFRWVIGAFVLGYVLLVTTLSVIPMAYLSKVSIEKESQRRALTIAQGLHDRYQIALQAGLAGNFDTRFAEREEGVRAAFILNASDGAILAPVSRSGAYADEPFVHSARKSDSKLVSQIDEDSIGASIPIEVYDPQTGLRTPKAYAMVVYNMGSLAVDNGRVTSLFVQVLGIAGVLGFLLFILLYRVIEAPIRHFLGSLDEALRTGKERVESPYNYPTFQRLALSVSSLMSRALNPNSGPSTHNKDIISEATQLVRLMTNPGVALDPRGTIIALNSAMAGSLNISLTQLEGASYSQLPDDALISLIPELLDRIQTQGQVLHSSPIHFKSQDLEINLQPIAGPRGVDYFIVTLTETSGGA